MNNQTTGGKKTAVLRIANILLGISCLIFSGFAVRDWSRGDTGDATMKLILAVVFGVMILLPVKKSK